MTPFDDRRPCVVRSPTPTPTPTPTPGEGRPGGAPAWRAAAAVLLALTLAACGGGRSPSGTDLVVSGVGPAVPVASGQTAFFTMTVRNAGPNPAKDVRIVNQVGNQLALTGIGCTAAGGATCPDPVGVAMTVPRLPVGGSLEFEVGATVTTGGLITVANTMTATIADEIDRGDNSATATGSAFGFNLAVSGSGPADVVRGGQTGLALIRIVNEGPGEAREVEITHAPGDGLELGGPVGCTASGGAVCPPTGGAVQRAPLIPIGGELNLTVPLTVGAGANGLLRHVSSVRASGDIRPGDDSAVVFVTAASADLGISMTAPERVGAGGEAVFRVVVANPGPGPAFDLTLRWQATAAFALAPAVFTCTAVAGAECPAALGPVMVVPTLPAGRALVFTVTQPVPDDARGALVAVAQVDAGGDPDPTNNRAESSVVAEDQRNGGWRVFAADGREYELAIDFDAGRYTMAGNGRSDVRSFAADASGGYTVGGVRRLRTGEDIIVGGHDFAAGTLPYVALRRFVTTAGGFGGSLNLLTRQLAADGSAAVTRAATASLSGNLLQVCDDDFEVVRVPACGVSSLRGYELEVDGELFRATPVGAGRAFDFRIARVGSLLLLVSTGADTRAAAGSGRLQWRVGLPDSAGLVDQTGFGPAVSPSRAAGWVQMAVTRTTFAVLGNGLNDVSVLSRTGADAPFGMLRAQPQPGLAGHPVWVAQAWPLLVVAGDFVPDDEDPDTPEDPKASGLLQLALP